MLILGAGDLGVRTARRLLQLERSPDVVLCRRSTSAGEAAAHALRLEASLLNRRARVAFRRLDLRDRGQLDGLFERGAPDLILHTAAMAPWWLPQALSPTAADALPACGFGAWLPLHLALIRRVMEAVRGAGYGGIVLNASYPDVTNPVLRAIGLAPDSGVGNVDELAAKVAMLASEELGIARSDLSVSLVCHHSLDAFSLPSRRASAPPYFLDVRRAPGDGLPIEDAGRFLFAEWPLPAGRNRNSVSAASAAAWVEACLGDEPRPLHGAGARGLPGGYPVWASREGVELRLPDALTLQEAVAINERSHRFDGIERITEDGTVHLGPREAECLESLLGISCEAFGLDEIDDRAEELSERLAARARGLSVGKVSFEV